MRKNRTSIRSKLSSSQTQTFLRSMCRHQTSLILSALAIYKISLQWIWVLTSIIQRWCWLAPVQPTHHFPGKTGWLNTFRSDHRLNNQQSKKARTSHWTTISSWASVWPNARGKPSQTLPKRWLRRCQNSHVAHRFSKEAVSHQPPSSVRNRLKRLQSRVSMPRIMQGQPQCKMGPSSSALSSRKRLSTNHCLSTSNSTNSNRRTKLNSLSMQALERNN